MYINALCSSMRRLVSYSLAIAVEPRQAQWYYLRGKAYEALADETEADGKPARAREMRKRAERNFGVAKKLDPITDFAALEDAKRSEGDE